MGMRSFVVAVLVPVLLFAGCRQPPETETRVVNSGMGIALADVPDGFSVVANDEALVLRHEDGGELEMTSGAPERTGVNLIEAVKARQAAVEGAGGEFKGSRELRTPWGAAFTARSRFGAEDGAMEEMTIFALNPSDSRRMLRLAYECPAGDGETTTERIQQLVGVLSLVEPGGSPGASS